MDNCINPIFVVHKCKPYIRDGITFTTIRRRVPCGKCLLCLNSRRMSWMMRIEHEQRNTLFPYQWFLTLTYNEKKVPRKKGVRTLYKRHCQLFFKRVRKAGYKCKYILVGEYGSRTARPHYHVIIWTTAPFEVLDKAWSYGFIHYRRVGRESILYTLKYILNPRVGDDKIKAKEFAVFSKGIGEGYLSNAVYDWHTRNYEYPIFYTVVGGRKVPLPRYYRNKIFTKYQLRVNADRMYYESLKKRLQAVRRFKELKYKSPFHQVRLEMLDMARKVKVKSDLYKEKL